MLIGIVGYPDLDYYYRNINIRGCGKTLTMTYYLLMAYLKEKRTIISNYHIKINDKKRIKYMPTDEIVDIILSGKVYNVSVGFDEFQDKMTSLGEKKAKIKFYSKLINQSRKANVDIYYCSPLFKDINNRVREKTNVGLNPIKRHVDDNSICFSDSCERPHYIQVNCFKPIEKVIRYLNPEVIGKYYDTMEIINENDEFDE